MENKTIKQTILGTLQGMDNEGSAKRASVFYLMAVSMTMLTGAYIFGFIVAVLSDKPTSVHLVIVQSFITIVVLVLLAATTWLGFATLELITAIIRKWTGTTPPKETPPSQ